MLIEVSREDWVLSDFSGIEVSLVSFLIARITYSDLVISITTCIVKVLTAAWANNFSAFSTMMLSQKRSKEPMTGLAMMYYIIGNPVCSVISVSVLASEQSVFDIFHRVSSLSSVSGGVMSQVKRSVHWVLLNRRLYILKRMRHAIRGDDDSRHLVLNSMICLVLMNVIDGLFNTYPKCSFYLPSQIVDLRYIAFVCVVCLEFEKVMSLSSQNHDFLLILLLFSIFRWLSVKYFWFGLFELLSQPVLFWE